MSELKELDTRSQNERVKDFSQLLEKIQGVDDKKKQIWKEIYENAISDRQNAFVMFVKLATITGDKTNEWAVHGKTMATFLERMGRANDQLIKLAELISRSDPTAAPIDSDEMFKMITKKS